MSSLLIKSGYLVTMDASRTQIPGDRLGDGEFQYRIA